MFIYIVLVDMVRTTSCLCVLLLFLNYDCYQVLTSVIITVVIIIVIIEKKFIFKIHISFKKRKPMFYS